MVTIPYGQPGVAKSEEDVFTGPRELFYSDHSVRVENYTQAANSTLLMGQVVGVSGGVLVPAVSGSIPPVGIVINDSVQGAGTKVMGIYTEGNFNMQALVWDASYNTDALKEGAFRVAGANNNIKVKKGYHGFAA